MPWQVVKVENAGDNGQRYVYHDDGSQTAGGYAPTKWTSQFVGRLPRPDRSNEVLVNQAYADQYRAGVGDRVRMATAPSDTGGSSGFEAGPLHQRGRGFVDEWLDKRVTVVGSRGVGEAQAAGAWPYNRAAR